MRNLAGGLHRFFLRLQLFIRLRRLRVNDQGAALVVGVGRVALRRAGQRGAIGEHVEGQRHGLAVRLKTVS